MGKSNDFITLIRLRERAPFKMGFERAEGVVLAPHQVEEACYNVESLRIVLVSVTFSSGRGLRISIAFVLYGL